MGRPLNKKYFGNRNIGSLSTTADNHIGGEGVASVTIGTPGTYTSSLPTATFKAPSIPTGVRATGTVHGNALTAVASAAGTGYNLADVLTQTAGGTGVAMATWRVTGLKVVGITLNNGGSANDVGDIFEFRHSSFSTPLQVRVTASTSGTATAVEIVNGGMWVSGALPGNTGQAGFTRVQTFGTQDMNGTGLQVNFTAWGVGTVAYATQGDYTAVAGGAKATSVTPAGGTGATLTITYGVSGIVIDEKGSGYTSASDAAVTFSGGASSATVALTTDSGGVGSATNQENAIIAHAKTTSGGTDQVADIIKQESSHRYLVRTADGIAQCKLVATTSITEGQMYITATDTTGSTYYVTKLTARKAILTRKTSAGAGWLFATGAVTGWTMGSPTATAVQVENA
jgi:hypothetical protein